ncbi:hypothetical protein [Desulfobacter postgatei]|uniref:hypothetical protein n=1 Tax=Desulfobacter postgatei TaxID=2293 RepID=UPI00259B5464|nr:hypothetical protein [uncultured Desulfobacter sp.]
MNGTISANMCARGVYGISGADEGFINGDVSIDFSISDISTSGSTFVVSPVAGKIKKIYCVIKNAITTADAALTFEIGGVAVTGGGITVGYDGSAAGDVYSATPTALNTVAAGQAIECITDGGSSTACQCTLTIVINATA